MDSQLSKNDVSRCLGSPPAPRWALLYRKRWIGLIRYFYLVPYFVAWTGSRFKWSHYSTISCRNYLSGGGCFSGIRLVRKPPIADHAANRHHFRFSVLANE